MRDGCIALLYDHVRPGISLEEYAEALTWWEIEPIIVSGELAGALMAFRNKLHIVVKPEFHGRWFRRWMTAFLKDRIDEYGPIQVRAFKDNPKALHFLERLGFTRIDEDESTVQFEGRLICPPLPQ